MNRVRSDSHCILCSAPAAWIKATEDRGDFPYCDEHADRGDGGEWVAFDPDNLPLTEEQLKRMRWRPAR